MTDDRDEIPFGNRSNQDNLSFQINNGAQKPMDDNSVGCLSVNPLSPFGNRKNSNSSNAFVKEFDMCGLPNVGVPGLGSIDNSYDNDLFFGSRVDAPQFISPMNKNTKKRSNLQNSQFGSQPQYASNVPGGGNLYSQYGQMQAGDPGYIKPLPEPQPVLTEQEIQQQSLQQAKIKFHKSHDLNCGCRPNFKCALHQAPQLGVRRSKNFDQIGMSDNLDFRNNMQPSSHQYSPMISYNNNPQGGRVMGQQGFTQEQIQQAAYNQSNKHRSKHIGRPSSSSALQSVLESPQYQNLIHTDMIPPQNDIQLAQQNQRLQQKWQQNQLMQQHQRSIQQAQQDTQAWYQQQLLKEESQKRRSMQKDYDFTTDIVQSSAQYGGIKVKMNQMEQPSARANISINQVLVSDMDSGTNSQQRIHSQQQLFGTQQIQKPEEQPQGVSKHSADAKAARKQVISIDFAGQAPKPVAVAKATLWLPERLPYQPRDKPRAATIVIPRHEPHAAVPQERDQSQVRAPKQETAQLRADSQMNSQNFSNHADSQVSSIQNSLDEPISADSNKADLGNKQKVEFAQDITSQQVIKANYTINTDKKLAMTINEKSMASSRLQENLKVSIALGNKNKKAKNLGMKVAEEKRVEQTESFNNQSFAGKSKNSRLVSIPIGDTNREASCLMGSVDQSKEPQKRQKVSISFNQSDKKPPVQPEIVIPAPPPKPTQNQVATPMDPQRAALASNVPSQDGGSVLKQILKNQITSKSTFVPQPVGDQYKHLQKQDVQSTTTSKQNIPLGQPLPQSSTQLTDINALQNLLPAMIYQQAQNQLPQKLMATPLPGARTPPKHQPTGEWLKQRPEQPMKYQNIQSHNSNFVNYKIEAGQGSEFFDKPGTQRRNRFNLGNQQQHQSVSQPRSNKAKEHQAQQDHSMRPPDMEQFQMNGQLSGQQKFSDLAKQISYTYSDLPGEFRDNVTLQNDIRDRLATAAAQAAQATKLSTGQQQQLKFLQHHQEQSQTQNQSNNNANRSRAEAQSVGPQHQNSGSMTARQGSTPNNQVSAHDAKAGGNYDASSHHNISIGNFIKQDVIVNIHMGNMAIANPGAKDARPQQPQAEAEAPHLSQAPSGKTNSGHATHAYQQELGQAIGRQMASSTSRDQHREQQNSISPPVSAQARSTVAVASEQLHHEMTMSNASSKHLNFTAKIEPPILAGPVEDQKGAVAFKSISSGEASAPASSMQAQPGSSNSNSQQAKAALTLISTFQQLMQGQAHKGQELELPQGQNPHHQVNFDNAPPPFARMEGAKLSNLEEQDAGEQMLHLPANYAGNFLSKVQDSLQQLHRIEQTDHIEKLINITQELQANQQQNSQGSQQPFPTPTEDLLDQAPVQQLAADRARVEQPARSGGPSAERKSEDFQQAEKLRGKSTGRGRGNGRGGGRGVGRGGARGRGARGAAAAARSKIDEAAQAAASPQREQVEELTSRVKPEELQQKVRPEATLEEMKQEADPDPTSQSAKHVVGTQPGDMATLFRQKLQKLTTKSDNPAQPDNFNNAEEWTPKPQSEAELNNLQQKIDTNNMEMMNDLQNISYICDIKVFEEINLVKQAIITNAPAPDQGTNVQQIQKNNKTLEDQVQDLFTNFQANLNHIQNLHEQINAAVDQGQEAEVDEEGLPLSQHCSQAQEQVPEGHDTLRLMQAQIENIQKIAKETQKFHEFFQHANMAPALPSNINVLAKGRDAQDESVPRQNGVSSLNIRKSSNGNWKEPAPAEGEEKLEELQARDQTLKQKRQIIEQQLESIYNQQLQSNSCDGDEEKPKEQEKISDTRRQLKVRHSAMTNQRSQAASEVEREPRAAAVELEKVQARNRMTNHQKKIFQISGEKVEKPKQRKPRKRKADIEQEKAAFNSNEAVIGERNANISSTPPRMELQHLVQAAAFVANEDMMGQVQIASGLPVRRLVQEDVGQQDRRLQAQGNKKSAKATGQWQSSHNLSSISSELKGVSFYQPANHPGPRRGGELSQASAKQHSEELAEARVQAKESTSQLQLEVRSPKPIFICTKVRPSITEDAQKGVHEAESVLRKRTRQQAAQKNDPSDRADIEANKSIRSGGQVKHAGNEQRIGQNLQNESDIQNAKRRITISLDFEKEEECTSNKRLLKIEVKNKEQLDKNQARISLIVPSSTQPKQAENNADSNAATQMTPAPSVPLMMATMPQAVKVPLRVGDKKSCVLSIDLKGPKTVPVIDPAQRGQTHSTTFNNLAADPAKIQLQKRDTSNGQSLLGQIAGIQNAKKSTPIINQDDAADKRQSWPAKLEADALKPEARIELSDTSRMNRVGEPGQEMKVEAKAAKNTNYLLKELQSLRPDAEELLRMQGTGQTLGQESQKRPQRSRKCKQKSAMEPDQPKPEPNEREGPTPTPAGKRTKAGRKASPKSGKKSARQHAEQEIEAQKSSDAKVIAAAKAPAPSAVVQSLKEVKAQALAPAASAGAHVDWELLGPAANGAKNKRAAKQVEKQELKTVEDKREEDVNHEELVGQLGFAGDVNIGISASKPTKRARRASKEGTQLHEQQEDAAASPKGSKILGRTVSPLIQELDKKSQAVEAVTKGLTKAQTMAPAAIALRNNLRPTTQRHLFNSLQSSGQTGGLESSGGDFQTGGGPQGQYNLVQCDAYPSFETQPYRIYFTFEVQMLMYIHSYLSKNEVIGLLGGKSYDSSVCVKGSNEPIKYLIVSKIYPSESCIKTPSVRLKNCEISDDQQIKIQEQMDKDGVVKLAWYHSHPIFEVDPSVLDLQTHQRQQSCFDSQGLPFFGVIIGPYHARQGISETLFKVFHLKEDRNQNKQRTVKLNFKDRGRALQHKIIPNTKLKYSMYQDIKQMIRQGSTHKYDRPDLAQEWGTRRNKTRYTNQEKFMRSLEKVCDENLKLQSEFDVVREIRDQLKSKDDCVQLDAQLYKTHEPPLTIMLQQSEARKALAQPEQDAANGEPLAALEPDVTQYQLPQEAGALPTSQAVQLQQNLQSRTFFSISESKKISKYLFKIEQCLIKNFGVKTQNLMEQTYKTLQQQESLENQEKQSANDNSKEDY